ncbi:MAG: hypothetical protein R2834_20350, partial [Rhodothermales bacterium]
IVLTAHAADEEKLGQIATHAGVQLTRIGVVTDGALRIRRGGQTLVDVDGATLKDVYENALPAMMQGKA